MSLSLSILHSTLFFFFLFSSFIFFLFLYSLFLFLSTETLLLPRLFSISELTSSKVKRL